jgi:hypothetical protein
VVTVLDDAAQELVRIARHGHRALVARDAREHSLLGDRLELRTVICSPAMIVELAARSADLVGVRDRARDDVPAEHRLLWR